MEMNDEGPAPVGSEYDASIIAALQQRILRLEAALKQLDNNDITAFKRLGGLEDRITGLEGRCGHVQEGIIKGLPPTFGAAYTR